MERNRERELYEKFFIPRFVANKYRPMEGKQISLADELEEIFRAHSTYKRTCNFTRMLKELDESMYEAMKREDDVLLREILSKQTPTDIAKQSMNEWFRPGFSQADDSLKLSDNFVIVDSSNPF